MITNSFRTRVAVGRCVVLLLFLAALAFGQPQTIIIPQIADGGPWQTTLVLANTTTGILSAALDFNQETTGGATQTWNLPFAEGSVQNMQLAAGATVFLHTLGTSPVTSVGWAHLVVSPGIVAYAIFTQRVSGHTDQDGTAVGASVAERFLIPFDNSGGFVTGVAITNPASASETVTVNMKTDTGAFSTTTLTLPAQGHTAFALDQQYPVTAGHRGMIEFYIARGSLSTLALRFNPTGALTTEPVFAQNGAAIVGVTPSAGR